MPRSGDRERGYCNIGAKLGAGVINNAHLPRMAAALRQLELSQDRSKYLTSTTREPKGSSGNPANLTSRNWISDMFGAADTGRSNPAQNQQYDEDDQDYPDDTDPTVTKAVAVTAEATVWKRVGQPS